MIWTPKSKTTSLESDELEALLKVKRNSVHLDETGHAEVGLEDSKRLRQDPLKHYVNIDTITDCWLWNGPVKNEHGYGSFIIHKTGIRAHRVFYELAFGKIPKTTLVCHKCDIPLCVQPNHLFAGTHQDNVTDCKAKGRAHYARGEDAGKAKLSETDVIFILNNYHGRWGEHAKLARKFGVTPFMVRHILARRSWKHVVVDREIPIAQFNREYLKTRKMPALISTF